MSSNSINIYQKIWTADQNENGVPALLPSDTNTPRDKGYVIVNEPKLFEAEENTKVFPEVVIPENKKLTYDLCEKLFNNYAIKASVGEKPFSSGEEDEIKAFINAIKDTSPMKIARDHIYSNLTDQEWFDLIKEAWSTFFLSGRKNDTRRFDDRSGFEHVFVGEDTGKLGGYHFWYKYFLDDGKGKNKKDAIVYGGATEVYDSNGGRKVPEIVTLTYKWDAYDTPNDSTDDLKKRIGGFWVGCSPEGLIALGMARLASRVSTTAIINGTEYDLKLYTDDATGKYINTFYPKFKTIISDPSKPTDPSEPSNPSDPSEPTDPSDPSEDGASVRIIAALVNPEGDDVGRETVTLINISNIPVVMNGWSIVDKNGNGFGLNMTFDAGEVQTIKLSGAPRTSQLGNKGGRITLVDRNGYIIDNVSYTKSQVNKQGVTLLF